MEGQVAGSYRMNSGTLPPILGCEVGVAESFSGTLQDIAPSLFLRPPRSPAGLRLGELEGPGKKAGICLLPHSPPDDHHSADHWLNSPLMVIH